MYGLGVQIPMGNVTKGLSYYRRKVRLRLPRAFLFVGEFHGTALSREKISSGPATIQNSRIR
jgi:hypothetical protein